MSSRSRRKSLQREIAQKRELIDSLLLVRGFDTPVESLYLTRITHALSAHQSSSTTETARQLARHLFAAVFHDPKMGFEVQVTLQEQGYQWLSGLVSLCAANYCVLHEDLDGTSFKLGYIGIKALVSSHRAKCRPTSDLEWPLFREYEDPRRACILLKRCWSRSCKRWFEATQLGQEIDLRKAMQEVSQLLKCDGSFVGAVHALGRLD